MIKLVETRHDQLCDLVLKLEVKMWLYKIFISISYFLRCNIIGHLRLQAFADALG